MKKQVRSKKMKKILLAILSIAMVGVLGVAAVGCGEDKMTDTITVITRESGSGTRGAFIELTGVQQKDKDGNKTKSTTVKSGKNTIETSKFDIFFQNLESATVANVKTSNVSASADLTVKITYNTDKEPDTYTFYKGETGKYNFSIDGKIILGNVFDTYVNKIIEDAPKLAKGESITAI